MKYHDNGLEKNCLMIWEDIDPQILSDKPDIYRMLKFGIDKTCDTISIASQGGVNQIFRVFSPKIISTISPIFNDVDMVEIQRRCMVLQTQKLSNQNQLLDLIDLKELDFNGFHNQFNKFWNDENCIKFVTYKRQLSKIKTHGLSIERWVVSVDLLATLLTLEIEYFFDDVNGGKVSINDIQSGIDFINTYWSHHDSLLKNSDTILLDLLNEFVTDKLNIHLSKDFPVDLFVLPPSIIESKVNQWDTEGLIILKQGKKRTQIINTMFNLGYKLTTRGYVKNERQ
jgi:hypothetical protein